MGEFLLDMFRNGFDLAALVLACALVSGYLGYACNQQSGDIKADLTRLAVAGFLNSAPIGLLWFQSTGTPTTVAWPLFGISLAMSFVAFVAFQFGKKHNNLMIIGVCFFLLFGMGNSVRHYVEDHAKKNVGSFVHKK